MKNGMRVLMALQAAIALVQLVNGWEASPIVVLAWIAIAAIWHERFYQETKWNSASR